ncbi:MAG: hypothetical protein JNJ59_25655 [Deltaproteobacteria bacterium]|nr:hypothetical protein [Deltaproteobacteria bacterium]
MTPQPLSLETPTAARAAHALTPRRRRKASRLRTIGELFRVFGGTGRWWLTPLVVVLLVVAVALVVIKVAQVAAPFVYTLF